nr:MAG TPA: hypothetical protein [Crassvirales sp.]
MIRRNINESLEGMLRRNNLIGRITLFHYLEQMV